MNGLEAALRDLISQEVARQLAEITPAEPPEALSALPEVMTTKQVAEALDCTPQHVNALARAGAIRSKYDGNRRLFLREWVLDYVQSDRSLPAMKRADKQRLRARPPFARPAEQQL